MKYNMEKKPIFAEGLFWRKPAENSPDFVRGKMNVQVEKFIKFLRDNKQYQSEKGWINLQLLRSRDGGSYYFTVDTWKPEKKEDPELKALRDNHNKQIDASLSKEDVSGIPF